MDLATLMAVTTCGFHCKKVSGATSYLAVRSTQA